jgi:riboflavin kinase/FMN adenylyltransferase
MPGARPAPWAISTACIWATSSVIDLARDRGPLGIITFEPHPRQFFAPDAPPFRLMNAEARANRLAKLGVEHLFQLPFNARWQR